jgi:hypothetical protein
MPLSDEPPNRRRFPRRACQLGVRYRSGQEWLAAVALDLTPRGCRLGVGAAIELGARVTLEFARPLSDGVHDLTVEVEGVVCWCRFDGTSHQAGIEFDGEPAGLEDVLRAR